MILSRATALDQFHMEGRSPTLSFIRVYLAEERVFLNAGRRISLARIHEECIAIRDRLAASVPADAQATEERGSWLVVVPFWELPPPG